MPIRSFRFVSRSCVIAIVGVAALSLSLSACTTNSSPVATSTPTLGATETATPPAPSASATAVASGTAVAIACDQLISAQAMYDYNPNFALDTSYVPTAGSLAAKAANYRGLACGWVNETSREVIAVTVSQPSADALAQIGNELISSSNSVPTYQVEGYFQLNGTIGEAEAISTPYWITASSTSFLEPGDAAPIIAAARAGLGQ